MLELFCANKTKEKWRVDHEFAFFIIFRLQETNVWIGAAQEDIQTRVKDRFASFTVQYTFARMQLMEVVQ